VSEDRTMHIRCLRCDGPLTAAWVRADDYSGFEVRLDCPTCPQATLTLWVTGCYSGGEIKQGRKKREATLIQLAHTSSTF
jgi:hypothetical protein